MAKFTTLKSHAIPLPSENVDTDQIIPARFLKVTDKVGLGKSLFCDWRYEEDGSPKESFVLNEKESVGAQVLIAGDNFGCGSSREHAPWALTDWGFRAIVAPSFADIFKGNALKNGLLPIAVDETLHASLLAQVQANRSAAINVDLATQTITFPDGVSTTFEVDPFAKQCLLDGIDQIGYLMSHSDAIAVFEAKRNQA
jgi:3-isopropylmalate/(R)-2-methylmalate dehydratase small subunit